MHEENGEDMAEKKKFDFPLAWIGRIVGMSAITILAVLVMIAVNLKGRIITQSPDDDDSNSKLAVVSILALRPEPIEITEKYSGTIRPLERFQLSFKTTGRIRALGSNENDEPLDSGDIVKTGQLIAQMDTDLLLAQKAEIEAMIDFAQGEFDRALELRQQQGTISDSEFGRTKRELAVAQSQLKTLQTQIDDAVLRSPVDGIISKRFIKPGESVGLGQNVFEVIQVDQVKLVVGVPESKIYRMIGKDVDTQSLTAYVTLIGHQRSSHGAKPLLGKVRRVSETSDDKSGLFELEILLENRDRKLRPGMIAIAKIVVEKVEGFLIPGDVVFDRNNEMFIFVADKTEKIEAESPKIPDDRKKPNASQSGKLAGVAKKVVLKPGTYEYQGGFLVARELPESDRHVIVNGHRRLVDQRKIIFAAADLK